MPKKPIKITLKPVTDEQLFNRYLLNLETAFEKIFGFHPVTFEVECEDGARIVV